VPLVLRSIQKANWYNNAALTWLGSDDLQADVLRDLGTKGNRLSVYVIDDECARLERVAVALATTKGFIKQVDYALLEYEVLTEMGIKVDKTEGATPDKVVNTWHLEFVELTIDLIVALARMIRQRGTLRRIPEKRIKELTVSGVNSRQLEIALMKEEMRAHVDLLLKAPNS
jgi:hypothetical protein